MSENTPFTRMVSISWELAGELSDMTEERVRDAERQERMAKQNPDDYCMHCVAFESSDAKRIDDALEAAIIAASEVKS